ncbi:MAG: AMP-binding protein [Bacteroidaceae bacterium]|nr:AMP-binding protein [Bacteroidaceae bacterium]
MRSISPHFNQCLADSIREFWEMPALSDYGINTLQYKDVARNIEKWHILFEKAGIKPGDKIALCGRNQSRWGVAFFAILTYGAVAVPILHEFHPNQVHDIVNHSESRMLFVGDMVWKKLDVKQMPAILGVISNLDDSLLFSSSKALTEAHEHLNELFGQKFPKKFLPQNIKYHQDKPDELCIINYTSGTTSNSKGVMIPYRAIWSNMRFAYEVFGDHAKAGDAILSMLPMAHTYGMSFEFIYEFTAGVHVNFLTKMPTPAILLKALADVRPAVLIVVPLILEKIVKKAVLPKVQDPIIGRLMKTPVVGRVIKRKICEGIREAFGGRFYEVIVGASAMNQEIEELLHDIGFNYTIGYGATECAPILAYEDWHNFVPGSCGKAAPRMELRIDSSDPHRIPGEILARGMNVMLGYYKNEEATRETLRDGWYHTGDLGIIDRDGNVFIKGRSKNMLLGANGQNIYPEEIEDKLNSLPMVAECVVIQKGEKIYGLVYPDMEACQKQGMTAEAIADFMETNRQTLNRQLPAYEQIAGIKVMKEEFEKTPKKSIKRFLYTDEEV